MDGEDSGKITNKTMEVSWNFVTPLSTVIQLSNSQNVAGFALKEFQNLGQVSKKS